VGVEATQELYAAYLSLVKRRDEATVRNQATVGVFIKGGEHGVLGSIYKEREEER
jgi:hypothetical protein